LTYLEAYQSAAAQVGVWAPQVRITSLQGLVWVSEALHEYQIATGVARCTTDITLDATNTSGHYDLFNDIDSIEKIEYYGVSPADGGFPIPVNMVDYDTLQRLSGQQGIGLTGDFMVAQGAPFAGATFNPTVPYNATLPGTQASNFYAARYNDCELWIYPTAGLTGILRLYYKPYMLPYTPSAEGPWKRFGNPPDSVASTTQLPREFNAAILGIKNYVMAQITSSIAGHQRLFPGKYEEFMNRFQYGVQQILESHPIQNMDSRPTPHFAGGLM